MKKYLVGAAIFSMVLCRAQSHDQGTVSLNMGWDAGIHGTEYSSKYNGSPFGSVEENVAGTSLFRVNGHYNLLKFFSAGIDFRTGNYIEGPENAEADGNKINMLALSLRLYPVNTDKLAFYIGANFGTSGLEINRRLAFNIPAQYVFRSGHLSLESGFHWYFAKNVGMNFGFGVSRHDFLMREFYLNNSRQNIDNFENRLKAVGLHFNFGLSFQFGG